LSYLVEGISEALTIRLARMGIHVAPWTAVLKTNTDHSDLAATAELLGAKTLLVLSAKAKDASFDVRAEWLDPGLKRHLWGKRCNRLHDDRLSVEVDIFDEVAGRIAPGLLVQRGGAIANLTPPSRGPISFTSRADTCGIRHIRRFDQSAGGTSPAER
jgi:TolB-like protein